MRDVGRSWEKWQDAEGHGGSYAVPHWVGFDGPLLALGRCDGGMSAVSALDPKTRQLEPEPMISLQGYDFATEVIAAEVGARPESELGLATACVRNRRGHEQHSGNDGPKSRIAVDDVATLAMRSGSSRARSATFGQ